MKARFAREICVVMPKERRSFGRSGVECRCLSNLYVFSNKLEENKSRKPSVTCHYRRF
jgi:hypothetical protein